MKNITLFYCKQTSVLLNTKRKGYQISHRLLPTTTTTTLLYSPFEKCLGASKPPLALTSGTVAWLLERGEASPGLQPCVLHRALDQSWFATWGVFACRLSAGYQFSNTSLDEHPGFIFRLLPTILNLIFFPFFFSPCCQQSSFFFFLFFPPLFLFFFLTSIHE